MSTPSATPSFQPPPALDARAIVDAYERLRGDAPALRLSRTTTTTSPTSDERVTVDAHLVDGEWIGRASFEGLHAIGGARAAGNETLALLLLSRGVNFATLDGNVHVDRSLAAAWGVGVESDGSEYVSINLLALDREEQFVLSLFAPTELAPMLVDGDTTLLELISADSTGSSYGGQVDGANIMVDLDPTGYLRSLFVEGSLGLVGAVELDMTLAAATRPPETGARADDEDVTQAFKEYVPTRSTLDVPGD